MGRPVSTRKCSMEGCDRKHGSRGYCPMHARRLLKHGDPSVVKRRPPIPVEERFWGRVEKTEACWNWIGFTNDLGYGFLGSRGKSLPAYRVSYEIAFGPIPPGLSIDHKCHNTSCVRPEHLRAVTHKQNMENRIGPNSNSRSGVRGVYWHKRIGKWQAQAHQNGKHIYLGYFAELEDAEAAVIAKRIEIQTHNDHDRTSKHGTEYLRERSGQDRAI